MCSYHFCPPTRDPVDWLSRLPVSCRTVAKLMVKNTSRQFKQVRILSSFLSSVASRLTYFGEGPIQLTFISMEHVTRI